MSSLQQSPAVGQVAPPAALIDGVSQQQIGAAVKKHVRQKAKPVLAAVSQEQAAIEMALSYVEHRLEHVDRGLCEDVSNSESNMGIVVQMVGWVAMDELRLIRQEAPTSFEAAEERLMRLASLCRCMSLSYDLDGTWLSRSLKGLPDQVDAIFEMIEVVKIRGRA